MEEMNPVELPVEQTIEANTLKIPAILNECKNLQEAKQKIVDKM